MAKSNSNTTIAGPFKAIGSPTVTTGWAGYVEDPVFRVRTSVGGVRSTIDIELEQIKELAPKYIVWVDRSGRLHKTNYKIMNTSAGTNVISYNINNKDPVKYIYSPKSRVIRGTQDLIPVRLKSGVKGWLASDGRFYSMDEFRELLHNIDQTSPAAASDISLLDAWDSLNAQQQVRLFETFRDFDWDAFWEEIGSDDPDRDLGKATDAYDRFVETVGELLGW